MVAVVLLGLLGWGFLVFLSAVWIFSWVTRLYYHTTCPGFPSALRDAEIEIVELSARANFRKEIDTINADVVVFGHTHVPEKCYDVEGTKKQLVNGGSWITYEDRKSDCGLIDRLRLGVRRSKLRKRHKGNAHDTFVYIDRDGPLLLRWDDDENCVRELPTRERCLEH